MVPGDGERLGVEVVAFEVGAVGHVEALLIYLIEGDGDGDGEGRKATRALPLQDDLKGGAHKRASADAHQLDPPASKGAGGLQLVDARRALSIAKQLGDAEHEGREFHAAPPDAG